MSEKDPNLSAERLTQLIERLRAPAGPDPRFNTRQGIEEHYEEFVAAYHLGLKQLHFETFGPIAAHQKALAHFKSDVQRCSHLRYTMKLWYRFNDSIAWTILLRKRHLIKRLWGSRPRPSLLDQDIESILDTLAGIYLDGDSMAVWADATSFIDVGDVLVVNRRTGEIVVAEIKTGKVNKAIVEGHGAAAIEEKFGKKGRKQFERVQRQKETMKHVVKVMHTDDGFDPFLKRPVRVVDSGVPDEFYDERLEELCAEAERSGEATGCIDGCLWLYISKEKTAAESQERFLSHLRTSLHGDALQLLETQLSMATTPTIFPLQHNAHYPISLPLYVRGLTTRNVVDIVTWQTHVLLFFDWIEFANLISREGGAFSWSSEKQARRALCEPEEARPLIIAGRIPQFGSGKKMQMGAPRLLCMLSDGQTPASVAKQEASRPTMEELEKE